MEVKIGVQNANRELVLDTDQEGEDVAKTVAAALEGGEKLLTLTDNRGRRMIVPTDKLAYIEIGSPTVGQVGFRS